MLESEYLKFSPGDIIQDIEEPKIIGIIIKTCDYRYTVYFYDDKEKQSFNKAFIEKYYKLLSPA